MNHENTKNAKIFYLYPNSISRKLVFLKNNFFTDKFYTLYGKDQAEKYNFEVFDDFDVCEKIENSKFSFFFDFFINNLMKSAGFIGGDWFKVLKLRKRFKKVNVIFSITDRVGIPLLFLRYFNLVPQKPVLYISIGLSDKLIKKNYLIKKIYKKLFKQKNVKVICFGWEEAIELRKILGINNKKIIFLPFGVDTNYFKPTSLIEWSKLNEEYILFIGADTKRDYELLFQAAPMIKSKILFITTKNRFRYLKKKKIINSSKNINILTDIPFPKIKNFIARAKFIILPVKENFYSGATTTLLQSMAMGKTVIVSKTKAIKQGYYLFDRVNCLFVQPEDQIEFVFKVNNLLKDKGKIKKLEINARKTVEKNLSWDIFLNNIFSLMKKMLKNVDCILHGNIHGGARWSGGINLNLCFDVPENQKLISETELLSYIKKVESLLSIGHLLKEAELYSNCDRFELASLFYGKDRRLLQKKITNGDLLSEMKLTINKAKSLSSEEMNDTYGNFLCSSE